MYEIVNDLDVSVLFSEPKIPQKGGSRWKHTGFGSFSALQRAENSSNAVRVCSATARWCFSALQRAENSSKRAARSVIADRSSVSVLFSEPKIPQTNPGAPITQP